MSEAEGGSPMREAGKGGSAVLERLASSTAADSRSIPRQSQLLGKADREDRIARAIGTHGLTSEMFLIALMLDALLILIIIRAKLESEVNWGFVGMLALPLLALTIAGYFRRESKNVERRKVETAAMLWPERQPFRVTGFEDFLASDRQLVDLHLAKPFDAKLFRRAIEAIDPAIQVEVIDDNTGRLALPAISASRGKRGSVRYGNVPLLQRVFAELVLPLHNDVGVDRVELGGIVDERPDSP